MQELLSHSSGIGEADLSAWFGSTTYIMEQRIEVAGEALSYDFGLTRGEFSYSNTGYIIAAVMLERIAWKSWEELIDEHLFTPLNMVNSGFLAPTDAGSPWGHDIDTETPSDPSSVYSDNPAVIGPAGVVHTTLEDIAQYINLHLDKGQSGLLLNSATFDKLHTGITDINQNGFLYSLGWNVSPDASVMYHSGSNTKWLAQLTINHTKKAGIFIAMNIAGPKADEALDLIGEYLVNREEALNN